MNAPRVTVLMCVHNAARWLHQGVRSVLDQTFTDFEFLILDDASTDESVGIAESFTDARIRLIRGEENIGLTRLLNRGLLLAKGELVARHDADDFSSPTRLAEQVAFLDAHRDVVLVGTGARSINAAGRSRGVREVPCNPASIRWLSLLDNPIIHTSAMFRIGTIRDEFGGYDESFATCQDYDLWTRVMVRYPVANLPHALVTVREHGASVSTIRRSEAKALITRVVRRAAPELLPALQADEQDIALLCAYRRHLDPEELPDFHRLLSRIDAALSSELTNHLDNQELARTRAAVFARVGYNLLTKDRLLAWSEILRALRTSPTMGVRLPWPRIVALSIIGGGARDWIGAPR